MDFITIPKPNNGHGHPRQDELFAYLIRIMMHIFHHYLGMGNTKPPILTAEDALRYKTRAHKIRNAAKTIVEFELHPVIKLREDTKPETVREAIRQEFRFFKLYPKSKTSHADDGIINYMHPNLRGCYEIIATERTPDGKKLIRSGTVNIRESYGMIPNANTPLLGHLNRSMTSFLASI